MSAQKNTNLRQMLQDQGDLCEKCGLCSTFCPSYQVKQQEPYSPRGRLALIQAIASEELPSTSLPKSLDACLGCRTCEAVCPAKVPYGQIFDVAQAILPPAKTSLSGKLVNIGLHIMMKVARHRVGHYLVYQLLRLVRPMLQLPGLKGRLFALPVLPTYAKIPVITKAATATPRGTILLLTGCISRVFERQALHDALKLLSRLGFKVIVPGRGHCCGALPLHRGQGPQAVADAKGLCHILEQHQFDYVTMLSSGCLSTLQDYADHPLLAPLPEHSKQLVRQKTTDLYALLAETLDASDWKFQAKPIDLTLHIPCTYRNQIGKAQTLVHLLSRIPQLRVHQVPATSTCCGAAGTYFIRHKQTAAKLRQPIITTWQKTNSTELVTCNVGCALHLQNSDIVPKISHPITVLLEACKAAV